MFFFLFSFFFDMKQKHILLEHLVGWRDRGAKGPWATPYHLGVFFWVCRGEKESPWNFPGQTKFGAGVLFFSRSFPISKVPKNQIFESWRSWQILFGSASCSCLVFLCDYAFNEVFRSDRDLLAFWDLLGGCFFVHIDWCNMFVRNISIAWGGSPWILMKKVMSSWRASPGQQGGGPFMGSGNSAKDRRARWITTIFPEGDERMQTCTPRSLA